MTKQTFAIIGLGRFGSSVCKTLVDGGAEVLVIDRSETKINNYKKIATQAIIADAQDENALKSIGIRNFDHVVVAIGEDIQASILVSMMVKEMGVKHVTAKAQNKYHARVLEKLGVDKVVRPEREMGKRIGKSLLSKNMLDYLNLSPNIQVAEIKVTEPALADKDLAKLRFRNHYHLNVIAIKRDDDIIISPRADQELKLNDSLLVVGQTADVDRFSQSMN
ncbi:MAG: TrkA family potassium uptake protein [Liquorilactobacillus ghanensis]|uniref:Trk family K+ transporter n=1 Tax=Liquorilactobacillus ghanensis DSM 18630 TaxID=1423750 RepID=A0A0R1VQ66_9LACO|nr:TrkA family potassium uptake protein [Liquorilactobacillus ghanensis]KRM07615.1 Trk family K+ transporter [Liquorilactobacillus ghanensis DSM 18630]